jgi:RNA polymerase sigma-70 factor (sigma-E family)
VIPAPAAADAPSRPRPRDREDDAFTAFVHQNHRRLLHTAELLTGDRGRAEDLLQTVLVRAYQRWSRIAQDNPVGYLRAALVNAHTDWWRRRSSWERPVAAPAEHLATADPTGRVAGRDAVLRALAPLTRRERAVIVLRFYEDLTVPQIADVLRIPAGTVKSTCARALAKLAGGPAPAVLVADGSPLAEAPDRFDPLTRTLDVGWIPDGLDGGSVTTSPYAQSFGAKDDGYVNGGPDIGLVVDVLSRGRGVDELPTGALGLPRGAQPRPTDPVGGGAAECLSDPNVPTGTCGALRWQYAPDAWAQVSYAGSAAPTPQAAAAVARRVAESVSLSAAVPVRLPFTLSGRLAGLAPVRTWVSVPDAADPIDGTRWTAEVDLAPDGAPDADRSIGPAASDVRVLTSWEPGAGPGRSTTVIDGHPARVESGSVTVYGVRGVEVSVVGDPDPVAAYGDVTVVDGPTDPAGWAPAR